MPRDFGAACQDQYRPCIRAIPGGNAFSRMRAEANKNAIPKDGVPLPAKNQILVTTVSAAAVSATT
jgi:hypothetical protein